MRRCGLDVGLVLLFAVGCGAGSPARRGPGSYAQAVDSVSATCERDPALCAVLSGKEAGASLQRRAVEAASAVKAWEELDARVQKRIEDILVECAKRADAEVNRREFGGRHPTREECSEVVGGTRENPRTRGMRLGDAKHALALQCTEEELSQAFPGRYGLEQRYRLHPDSRQLERIRHERELEMLRAGGKELAGSVIPDVVIHTGDPLQAQRVYDFKFPCPEDNEPKWRDYPLGNSLNVKNQGAAYKKVFDATPVRVTPKGTLK
ncbi:hypothetical protein [Pyxidicoccus xibeiensis]|uniref:hypothetical protein n=1 Tax=Pyxidicoccus xibeiensis TaxID=2906759 RepID=UPI0020A7880B|nr:hypothetical protein [Pyxidicoccus xibeiensis]MCP3144698.1 hypothetical protein [Pyxidicoccus xibeiensis]